MLCGTVLSAQAGEDPEVSFGLSCGESVATGPKLFREHGGREARFVSGKYQARYSFLKLSSRNQKIC